MNALSNLSKNLMFLEKDSQDADKLLAFCIECVKREKVVLYLTSRSMDIMPIIKRESLTKNQMELLVVVESENINGFIHKLLELHTWVWLPVIIAVDLRYTQEKLFDELELIRTVKDALQDHNSTEAVLSPKPYLQQLSLLIASLFGLHNSICKRLKEKAVTVSNCFSILILKEHAVHLTCDQIKLLINLYYYADNAYDSVDKVIELLKV